MKQFFHDLFRNKTFIIAYLIMMLVVAIILGYTYGDNNPTTYCVDRNGIEQPCPVGMGGTPTINQTTIDLNWSKT